MNENRDALLEERRLNALERLDVLNSAPEEEFDALAKAASLVCGTPISLITLLTSERKWFKANIGLEGTEETERKISFCTHAIEGDGLMEIEDATLDARFAENPFVIADPHIRFYAGAPLVLSGGEKVGTLCVIDRKAKTLTADQREILQNLAKAAARALELRRAAKHENELLTIASQSQSILEYSDDAIVTVDWSGAIRQWNRAAERMFGYSSEDMLGTSFGRLMTPEARAIELDLETRLGDGQSLRPISTERLHRDGARLPVSVSIGPVISATGKIVGATEIIRDISDLQRAYSELSEAEQRVKRLYQSTPAMLHSVDPTGRLLSVSDHWLEVMGYSREEVLGRPLQTFMTETSARRAVNEVMPDFLKTGHCEDVPYQMMTCSGEIIDVLLSAVLERTPDGAPLRTVGIVENITYRRKVEKALREERRRLAQIIQGTGAGTWEWNLDTGENRINERWSEMLGYTREEITPLSVEAFRALIHPADQKLTSERLEDHLTGKSHTYKSELRVQHKDGHWIWVISRGQVLTWTNDGKPEWMFGTHQDITQRKFEEEELRKSRESLERTGRVAGVGGWEVDLVEQTIYWSNETCRIHGVAPGYTPCFEEAINFYAPEARPVIKEAVEQCVNTGKGWDLHLQLDTAGGQRIWVRAVGEAEFENGQAIRLVGAFQDVSEQVAQRQALETINERFRVATENGRVGLWDADLAAGKSLYSDMWCALIGYTPDEISNDSDQWLAFIHPDDKERALQADAAHIRGEAPYFEEQFRMRHKDGHWVWILDRGVVTARADDGTPLRMIGTHTDITRQKHEEAERLLMGERMAVAADSAGIGIWEVDLTTEDVTWDRWMFRLYGLSEKVRKPAKDIWQNAVHPEDMDRVAAAARLTAEQALPMEEEYRIVWPDGSVHHLHVSARLVTSADDSSRRLIGAAWDITEERQMSMELADQHELMRVTLTSIGDAVITTDAQGRVEWLNPVSEYMTGWSVKDAHGLPSCDVFKIVNEETRAEARDPIQLCLEHGKVADLPEGTVLLAKDGREFAVEDSAAPILSADGEVLGAVLVFHDVTEQRRTTREMSYHASHDQLTGLTNRAEFERRMHSVFESAKTEYSENALLYIDLDQFKIVNDTCGHTVGDELLKKVSQLMQGVIRTGDTLARLGGDEFAMLLERCPLENATRIAHRVCDEMTEFRFIHEGKQFRVGASIGLVAVNKDATSIASILQAADSSCYAAKDEGRNRVHVWQEGDEAMATRLGETRWVSRIEQALENDRFVLYVQKIEPLSDLKTETGHGQHLELLIRMLGEDGSIIAPNAFMPAAERFNLASRIDRWVLENAIKWIREDKFGEDDVVAINLSGQSVGDRAFHTSTYQIIEDAGEAVCRNLCFEITETAVISNIGEAVDFINVVRTHGISVALDDFGAGTTSFSYLKRFAIDYLKIDGQFTQGLLLGHPIDEASIQCFANMAQVLGARTIAEFVSDERMFKKLRDLQIDLAQGFAIHKPVPVNLLKKPAND